MVGSIFPTACYRTLEYTAVIFVLYVFWLYLHYTTMFLYINYIFIYKHNCMHANAHTHTRKCI